MAVLFVSHSSKDDVLASTLETWLRANGFTDLFVDHQHIIGGAKWREELRASPRGVSGRGLPCDLKLARLPRMLQRVPRRLVHGQAHHSAVLLPARPREQS